MSKPNHGDITVETTPGFECWNVTATLHVDPKKMVLNQKGREEVQKWLKNMLEKTVQQHFNQPVFAIDMKISDFQLKTHCDTCGLPLACGIKVCKCPRKPHPIQCGVF